MLKHAISISCCLEVALLALFCITRSNTTLSLYLVVFGENSQISQKKKNFSVLTVNAKSTSF